MYLLLIPVIALFLAAGQATWATVFKQKHFFDGSLAEVAIRIVSAPKFWLGAALYVVATLVYFFALNKINFFVIQMVNTGLVIVISMLIAHYLFNEKILAINIVGMLVMMIGIYLIIGFKA